MEANMNSITNMTTDTLGNLDEFFDFKRLEAEGHVELEQLPHDVFVSSALDEMDWQCGTVETPTDLPTMRSMSIAYSQQIGVDIPWDGTSTLSSLQLDAEDRPLPIDDTFSAEDMLSPLEDVSEMPYVDACVPAPSTMDASHEIQDDFQPPVSIETPRDHLVRQSSASHRTPASAKRKGPNTRIPLEARQMLEEEFAANPYPCGWEIDIIAHQANLDAKRVRNWFNNARARKKAPVTEEITVDMPNESTRSLATKLSVESLETLSKEVETGVLVPQPPLAVYLASSYREEAADLAAIQAAIRSEPLSSRADTFHDSSSGSRIGRPGSVITSVASTDSSAPTTFTTSSRGSNISSFGRDRRRGRRRMTWKNSPYSRAKVNGVDDSGTPTQGLPFFCTFCPRAFKTKYEWIRHEDSVHALRTTWICCNTNPRDEPFLHCPFCGHKHPDDIHLASHKYQQCRNKPETQRTFYRRDHFVQHLHHVHFANVRHPAAKLGCQTKLTTPSGHDYGCKDLAMKWRRFGAPMRADDPMLHCGFCGLKAEDWDSRCNHVAEHLISGGFDRSSWWPDRMVTHLESFCSSSTMGPIRCRYCRTIFTNQGARDSHTHCRIWSCRFLRTCDDVASENAAPPLCPQFPSPRAHHCHLCGAGYKNSHLEHAGLYHAYRQCEQKLYTCEREFFAHLHGFHGASLTVVMGAHAQDRAVLEQHYSRNKGASFEPVVFDMIPATPVVCTTESKHEPEPAVVDGEEELDNDDDEVEETEDTVVQGQGCEHTAIEEIPKEFQKEEKTVQYSSGPQPESNTIHLPTRPSSRRRNPPPSRQRLHRDSFIPAPSTPPSSTPLTPRFFRLDPHLSSLPSLILYLRSPSSSSSSQATITHREDAELTEIPKSHIASLVMSSGLLGLVGARMGVGVRIRKGVGLGMGSGGREVEFGIGE
ncbi:hypothetical protein B0J11DRAFT_611961 [Dendryphion nanum]|uniref:Homeobox domain-containing protein n=1 Tax=Dendryphion nanum TaxID=256645 RepID=A0A9P9EFE8_9PLEO|nr:hypothetical protein B0J11DRAFT_611961 [Dendryphion nanum]